MLVCPACSAEVDQPSTPEGRCPHCGAKLLSVPQRTIHDARTEKPSEPSLPSPPGELETMDPRELPRRPEDAGETQVDPDTVETFEFDPDAMEEGKKPPTVSMGAEQTIQYTGSLDVDEVTDSMVTAQWQGNIDGGKGEETDTDATIKQKDTVTGTHITSSSLVVKSRQFRSGIEVGQPITSPDDAPDYELLSKIGEGGMGVVYSARQSSIARTVAIKMLKRTDSESAEHREKFISEAVVTGELDHPNIVPIYDLGSNDMGALFYSMKRVKGTPWDDVIDKKSLDENLNILLRVADAVAFAHANGVLHRDLKPENVMLGDYGEVLVMDWGLARISPEFPSADAVSQSDVMGGTPAYMAPEMATGPIEQVTIASDIYLLGAMLYEVIAAKPPHSGKTVMACLFAAAKNKIQPAEHSGELMEIALKAMATQPADRYASVQDFQAALRLYQSHSESVVLTDSASVYLDEALKTDDYDLFSRAMYGFEEALSLWTGNRRARELLAASRAAYGQSALERGDFDLGISLLDPEEESHADLLAKLEVGRQERASRNRRLKLLKGMVAALLAVVVAIVSIAYFAVRAQRNEAIAQRDRAVKAEGQALENYEAAEAARKVAETERKRAEDEKDRAEYEEARAKKQERIAVRAKQAEEYEAYVARIGLASAKIEENAFDRAEELLMQCNPELCDWEWGRLLYLCQLSQRTWRVDGPVEAVAFSPDGRHFATGDWDGKARLWDLETGAALHTISHGQYVHAVAFDSSGSRLATASSDRTIRVLDTRDGRLLQTLVGHTDAVLSARFSHDGRRLLTAGYDNTARVWDLATGKVLQVLQGHSWWVWAAEFSPDDRRIVTASQDGKAIVWQQNDAHEYAILTEFTKHRGPIYAAQFAPDGAHVATAGYDRRVLLWNPEEVEPIDIARRLDNLPDPPAPYRELAVHQGPVRSVLFSPDGAAVVSGGQDNVMRIWQLATDREVAVLRGHASHVRDCAFSPDGKLLLSAGRDQQIKLWQPETYGESLVLGGADGVAQSDAVLAARFSRDGGSIVTASRDRTAALWDSDSQELLQHFSEGHDFLVSASVFFAGGAKLATGAGDGTVRIWDVATGTEILKLDETGRTGALDVSEDGLLVVTGGLDNTAVVWNARSGQRMAVLAGHEAIVTAVCLAPDGKLLATADDHGRCRLWRRDAHSGEWIGSHWLRGHSRSISSVAFVKDGTRLITASGDNTCGQWDVATGEEITDLVLKHPDWVADMAVSADGSRILTCCDDGKLRLWALEDARLLQTIEPSADVVFTAVDLSPDGRTALAACAAQGTVQMWDLDTGQEIKDDPEQAAWLEFGGRSGIIWAARFAPQGNHVLTIGGNDARLWDVASRELRVRFSPHGAVAAADISPDGRLLVTGSWDQSAKIWNAETGQALHKLAGVHQGYVNSVEFSPDGKTVLTGSDDGSARLWNVQTGMPLEIAFLGHESRVRQARFSSDGTQVLTTANDKTARIWDAATGKSKITLVGHEWAVLCGEFSPDGRRVITGSEDNTAVIWDVETGTAELKLAGHTDSITSVAFSPDGARVLTGSQDNVAKLWDAHSGKEILTLAGHQEELTSVSFSPNGLSALTSGRDGATILWPAVDWRTPRQRQAARHR
ncbi:MAG: protein kinase [Pirellulales bacterium]|nr:protein kinase [Pirellulales bacterium]